MDLAAIHDVSSELNSELVGGIISKIFQPLPREVALKIFLPGRGEKRLMLSADPKLGRIHLTDMRMPNPQRPLRFCAYLRAHLLNARIREISCAPDDRIVMISCERRLMDAIAKRSLVLELLGRDSNIILVDATTNLIMDCLHHIPEKTPVNRAVLPGMEYVPPPKNPNRSVSPVKKFDEDSFRTHLAPFKRESTVPSTLKIQSHHDETSSKVNQRVDSFYSDLLIDSLIENLRRETSRPIKTRIRSLSNRTVKIENDLNRLEKYIENALYGELLKTALGRVKKGSSSVGIIDWESGKTIVVPLDPALDPVSNMKKFFAHSAKGKRGIRIANERLERTTEEKRALEDLLFFISQAKSIDELEALSTELQETKNASQESVQKVKSKGLIPSEPQKNYSESVSPSGLKTLVGKSAKGNEFIVKAKAKNGDLWFHVKDAAGSHVVLICRDSIEASDLDLRYCAGLAALNSKMRGSGKVEVMYTDVKNVSKVKGGLPGQVTVRNYKTLIIDLGENSVN